MSALRPETVLRRKLELQIALRYQTQLLELRAQVAQLQRELDDARANLGVHHDDRQHPPAPVPDCDCVWCRMAVDARALCSGEPKRSAVGPQG